MTNLREIAERIADETYDRKSLPDFHADLSDKIESALRRARDEALEEAIMMCHKIDKTWPFDHKNGYHIAEEIRKFKSTEGGKTKCC